MHVITHLFTTVFVFFIILLLNYTFRVYLLVLKVDSSYVYMKYTFRQKWGIFLYVWFIIRLFRKILWKKDISKPKFSRILIGDVCFWFLLVTKNWGPLMKRNWVVNLRKWTLTTRGEKLTSYIQIQITHYSL